MAQRATLTRCAAMQMASQLYITSQSHQNNPVQNKAPFQKVNTHLARHPSNKAQSFYSQQPGSQEANNMHFIHSHLSLRADKKDTHLINIQSFSKVRAHHMYTHMRTLSYTHPAKRQSFKSNGYRSEVQLYFKW